MISFNAFSESGFFLNENFSIFSPSKTESLDFISLSSYWKLLAMVHNSSGFKSSKTVIDLGTGFEQYENVWFSPEIKVSYEVI